MNGVRMMTLAERGAYITLLCHQWDKGSVPGDDLEELRLVLGCTASTARQIWDQLRKKFPRDPKGCFRNVRLEFERRKQKKYRKSQSNKGKASAAKRNRGSTAANARFNPSGFNSSSSSSSSSSDQEIPPKGSQREPTMLDHETEVGLIEILRSLSSEDRHSARAFHDAFVRAIQAAGWTVHREHRVSDRGDGRPGVVDVVVTAPARLAIELDRQSPRQKSLDKLRVIARAGYAGVVVCRDGQSFAWRRQGEIAVYAEARPQTGRRASLSLVDPRDDEHIRKSKEVKRLVSEEGLSIAEASRKVGYR